MRGRLGAGPSVPRLWPPGADLLSEAVEVRDESDAMIPGGRRLQAEDLFVLRSNAMSQDKRQSDINGPDDTASFPHASRGLAAWIWTVQQRPLSQERRGGTCAVGKRQG